jgi:serine O-acetyltransferase
LAHSALPDTEAQVIRKLMQRIDALEGQVARLQSGLGQLTAGRQLNHEHGGEAQNLQDREILEFLGEQPGDNF